VGFDAVGVTDQAGESGSPAAREPDSGAAEWWQGVNGYVLYSVQFAQELDGARVDWIAHSLLSRPLWDLTRQQEYDALAEALRSDAQLTEFIPDRHTEEAYRDFLRRLLARLDAARPWPELPFQELSMSHWADFAEATAAARIGLSVKNIHERLHRFPARLTVAGTEREVLMLRLRSGDEVALVTPWWPGSADTVILQRGRASSAEQVIAEFIACTGFTADEVRPLTRGR
jgi:hypothetical protein